LAFLPEHRVQSAPLPLWADPAPGQSAIGMTFLPGRPFPESGDAAVLAEPARPIFSRGDSNLLNWLWDGKTIRVVDYGFAGYSDLAFDLADLTEHISSREAGIGDQEWAEITDLAGLADYDRRRFEAAQRTCALRWLAVLWKQRDTRNNEFTS